MINALKSHILETSNSLQVQPSAWLSLENQPYSLPVHRKQLALSSELEKALGEQKTRKSVNSGTDLFQFKPLETHSDQRNRSTPLPLKLLRSGSQKLGNKLSNYDTLTGLSSNQAIVAGQSANMLMGSSYNTAYGYGLVNAAKAVAWAAGYYPYAFTDVPNWGGNHWGNDQVKAPEAWNQGFTGQGVTVAVIDSGVDIFHPDLDNNIWQNPGEIAGDGWDNDGNGYIDDLFGWNFGMGQNNNNVLPGTPDPGQSHGTHVAGTIAAEYNEFGTTGVAPNAKIMALRLGDVHTAADGTGQFTNSGDLAQAIYYAVNNGAKVINMSLGWTETSEVVHALAYAASRNVITVSASGNEGQSSPGNPAKYATHFGISVGAVDYYGNLANFSNGAGFDRRMQHVVAPGVEIMSTVPINQGWYGQQSGTSMAAPHVAGVVALMLSANPNLTHAETRYILTQSATG